MAKQITEEWNVHISNLEQFVKKEFSRGCTGIKCKECYFGSDSLLCDIVCGIVDPVIDIEDKIDDEN